ncbi:glycoside hydrolase family 2 TIM barrel-domain containing protein [uncultured Gelidibacter sp.]|uniref:glycoside hydrolase family 2 TIM barrel-domain containing protein n=1 Tax=uncultured Gelidibacter sp. TaxID=259318 RepID=UPI00263729AF|nr:glycoside hydrolase family 2 TIM barrel-domain containing protein [uncultured Gelidibacter sp.]
MRKRILIIFITAVLVVFFAYTYLHSDRGRVLDRTRTVFVDKIDNRFQLYRNGEPFYIKGGSGTGYLKEMSEAGGNTLRVYDTLNLKAILDEAEKFDIAVIVDIPLPTNAHHKTYYSNDTIVINLKEKVKNLVNQYKDHPSILMWNLGNELNFPLTFRKNNFIQVFNDLVDLIHEEDPNHLISTTISGTSISQILGIHLSAPKLDIIGFNVFSIISNVKPVMDQVGLIVDPLPYYISEWGNTGPWEVPVNLWKAILEPSSTLKSDSYKVNYLSGIKSDLNCLGSLAFYWGYKHEGTPTWFNIFDEEGRKSEMYYQLQSLWMERPLTITYIPRIEKLTLNNLESNDQIFVSNSYIEVQINMMNPINSNLTFDIKVFNEAWGAKRWGSEIDALQLSTITSTYSNKMKFKVPEKEGPYRVFVSVNDSQGNFATANMPFYVLNDRE